MVVFTLGKLPFWRAGYSANRNRRQGKQPACALLRRQKASTNAMKAYLGQALRGDYRLPVVRIAIEPFPRRSEFLATRRPDRVQGSRPGRIISV